MAIAHLLRLRSAERAAAPPSSGKWRLLLRDAFECWRKEGLRATVWKTWRYLRGGGDWQEIQAAIDRPLPAVLEVGKGQVLHVTGWCFHPASRIRRLTIVFNGQRTRVSLSRSPREDVARVHQPQNDPHGHSFFSGFAATIPVPAPKRSTTCRMTLEARLADGRLQTKELGSTTVVGESSESNVATMFAADPTKRPLVAVCMTTFNSPRELFIRQIESIRNQTYDNWICIISDDRSDDDAFQRIVDVVGDDSRFRIHRNTTRLGFYDNFAHCLSLVPEEAQFIALSDHDDNWHADKLETLLSRFDRETTLVYSDMNIVDAAGRCLSKTYWVGRKNNYESQAALLMANTITGAASMFRRSLLDYLLPFPPKTGHVFHDHWIACAALALGKIRYVDRPLYDYVQHGANVFGHYAPPRESLGTRLAAYLSLLSPWAWRRHLKTLEIHGPGTYLDHVARLQELCRVLLLRLPKQVARRQSRALRRLATMERSPITVAWLALRLLRRIDVTLGMEGVLVRGILWRAFVERPFRKLDCRLDTRLPEGPKPPPAAFHSVDHLTQKIAPLTLRSSTDNVRRVNVLVSIIDFKHVFAGYIAVFQLARRLAGAGHRVRLVLVDPCQFEPERWREQFRQFPDLGDFLDHVEVVYAFDRRVPIDVHPRDAFLATSWWTAHIAHAAVRTLRIPRFVYLTQDYEPIFYPLGTLAALADESYSLPHFAIYSTELLREYAREHRLGVYAAGRSAGDRDSLAFANAITDVGLVTAADLADRKSNRLLFYARPDAHNSRNMFEMGIMGLSAAVRAGHFRDGWEFYSIGTVDHGPHIELGNGAVMHALCREKPEGYRKILRSHDLGLSLMHSPHPSLVPIEMASAGMLTVTNTYLTKTKPRLRAISPNLIPVQPTIGGIAAGLREAVERGPDLAARARGAKVNWSTSWKCSLNDSVLARINDFIERSTQAVHNKTERHLIACRRLED